MFWFRWTWPSSCSSEKRSISIGLKLSEDLLKLLREETSRGKEVDEHR